MFSVHQSKNYKIVCWKIDKLKKNYKSIKNWKYNRTADSSRISNIQEHMELTGSDITPGIICAWDNGGDLEIYDGFHRFSACENIENCKILIKIITTTDENLIKKDFELVNKSLYVPAMYLETNLVKNNVCEQVFILMKNKFPSNVSYSNYPQQQNFNQNNIINIVKNLNIDFTKEEVTNKIYLALLHVNDIIKFSGLTPKYKKTLITGFWLFFWNNEKLIKKTNEILSS